MRRFIFFFLLLVGSVWVGLKMVESPGYVMVTYGDWAVETSLWIFLFLVLVTVFVLYYFARIVSGVSKIGHRLHDFPARRRQRKARKQTARGLRMLAEGDFVSAEHTLLKVADVAESPLINYLAAAKAAQGHNDLARRDEYLRAALGKTEDAEIAVGLTQAELQLDKQQLEGALATLEHLHQLAPKHPHILKLLMRVYMALEDWDAMAKLMPELRKRDVVTKDELITLEKQVYLSHFKGKLFKIEHDELYSAWKAVPKYFRDDADFILAYTNSLIEFGDLNDAEKLLHKTINHHWEPTLVRQYARVEAKNPSKQLKIAEGWLNDHPNDPHLLICLGELCSRNQLWGKAEQYLSRAHAQQAAPNILRELGGVYESLGNKEQALVCYREGLALLD